MLPSIWILPLILLTAAVFISIPLSRYLAWIMDGHYQPLPIMRWFEAQFNTGPQNWKQYLISVLIFSTALFIFCFLILALQPYLPLNPDGKTLLAPSAIFHSAASFMTNTDLQHYIGEQHLSNFSQIFFGISSLFISPAIIFSCLIALIRLLRSDESAGNFFLDVWRAVIYLFLPIACVFALLLMQQGSPMTLKSSIAVTTLENKPQKIVVGPVAAFEAIKLLGTNGGGFYAANSAHPFENPTGLSNFFTMLAMIIFPLASVLMYGRMLRQLPHSIVIYIVMLILMSCTIIWSIYFDTLNPNQGLIKQNAKTYSIKNNDKETTLFVPSLPALPLDQHLGNLEGKELRFGISAGALFASLTANITCGAVNAELDSLNPLAALSPLTGMWVNTVLFNLLMFVIIGIFLAGMMVGRTPEYLGKKIGAKEVKLAIIGLLVHPSLILLPLGLFIALPWGTHAISNPGPHGLTQMLYQFSSASANNGSALNGLGVVYGFWNNPNPAPEAIYWDVATGLIMIFGRFLPIIAMIAMAASLGSKKTSPCTLGTLRTDTITFGVLLLGTILIVGALLFLPAAVLGPLAEHLK